MSKEVANLKYAGEGVASNPIESLRTKYRFVILVILTTVITVSTADRATLSIAGIDMGKDLGISSIQMGYLFSAFAWAYMLGQIPSGWLGDKMGSKPIVLGGIVLWSMATIAMGFVFPSSYAFTILVGLRFLLGLFETPVAPVAVRIIGAWFPSRERGTAGAVFNCAQYLSLAIFTPFMGWIAHTFTWHYVYIVMGAMGVILALGWQTFFHIPTKHPKVNQAELDFITAGGGIIDLDFDKSNNVVNSKPKFTAGDVLQLFKSKMLCGIFIGQYCISTITYFYMTWFPIYLVKDKGFTILKAGFVASIPAITGFLGGVLAGIASDWIYTKTKKLSIARKIPITFGLLLSSSIIGCNYVNEESMVIFLMSLAFFGKGFAGIGFAVISDAAPKEFMGVTGAVFNMSAQVAGVIAPVVVGYLVEASGSFNSALLFTGAHAFIAIFFYWAVVGKIERLKLKF